MLTPNAIPAAVGALASAIACELSDEELGLLAAVLVQLGDSLALILAARVCAAPPKE